ncbi:hypothetical protein OQA88_1025 [Cercophora sp. LCS_1]
MSSLTETSSWDPDHLRSRFVQALSDMYRTEVPLYGDLVEIVQSVDDSILASRGLDASSLPTRHQLERHGAIRLGTSQEMRTISQLFATLGMHPAGYYDLSMVGFPLHGTAFRPVTSTSLHKNPFRVFTTVLRPDLIKSPTVRKTATDILSSRNLFSPRLQELMAKPAADRTASDADELITESLKIFKWHSRSTVPLQTYLSLKKEHPMVADIVCFPSAHINHLTPRTLDIDKVQEEMIRRGLPAKECIEGPPAGRKCEILLRQTSFKALEERVVFVDEDGGVDGTHTARFGEVEQRGAAVTRKGRDLYDRLLAKAMTDSGDDDALGKSFSEFPDEWDELRARGLVFFRYRVASEVGAEERTAKLDKVLDDAKTEGEVVGMEKLLRAGVVECEPLTYEDFLPLSAAGIFTSNLGDGDEATERKLQQTEESNSRAELEALLGQEIPSEIDTYEKLQAESVRECEATLGMGVISLQA